LIERKCEVPLIVMETHLHLKYRSKDDKTEFPGTPAPIPSRSRPRFIWDHRLEADAFQERKILINASPELAPSLSINHAENVAEANRLDGLKTNPLPAGV
jgi:hypothetical protein